MTTEVTAAGAARSPEEALAAAVVRVKSPDGEPVGGGFLVAPDLVLTCAHVVSDALRRPREDVVAAGTELHVDLPFASGAGTAQLEHWVPVRPDQTGDIAVLRLRAPIPGAHPVHMADTERVWGHDVRVPGFPWRSPGGVWHYGRLRGATAEGWLQLSQADPHGVPVEEGFSGSPVWDEQLRAVAGMVVVIQPGGVQQSFLIPTRTLVGELPDLAPVVRPATPTAACQPSRRPTRTSTSAAGATSPRSPRSSPGPTRVSPSSAPPAAASPPWHARAWSRGCGSAATPSSWSAPVRTPPCERRSPPNS